MGNYLNLIQNRPLNSTKIFKNRSLKLSWSTLGTLLEPKWRKNRNKTSKILQLLVSGVVWGIQNVRKISIKCCSKMEEIL